MDGNKSSRETRLDFASAMSMNKSGPRMKKIPNNYMTHDQKSQGDGHRGVESI
jgi:hypothetical protein